MSRSNDNNKSRKGKNRFHTATTTVYKDGVSTNINGPVSEVSVTVQIPLNRPNSRQSASQRILPVLPPTPPMALELARIARINRRSRNAGLAIIHESNGSNNPQSSSKEQPKSKENSSNSRSSSPHTYSSRPWDTATYSRNRPNNSLVNYLPESDTSLPHRSACQNLKSKNNHRDNFSEHQPLPSTSQQQQYGTTSNNLLVLNKTAEQRYRMMDRFIEDSEEEHISVSETMISAGSNLTTYGSINHRRRSNIRKFQNTPRLNRAAISVFEDKNYHDYDGPEDSDWSGAMHDSFSSGALASSLKSLKSTEPKLVIKSSEISNIPKKATSKAKLINSNSFQKELKSIIGNQINNQINIKANAAKSTWNQFVESLNEKLTNQRKQIEKEQKQQEQQQFRDLEKLRILQLDILEEQLIHYESQQNKANKSMTKTTTKKLHPTSKESRNETNTKYNNTYDQIQKKFELIKKQKQSNVEQKRTITKQQTQRLHEGKATVNPKHITFKKSPIAQDKKPQKINKPSIKEHNTTAKISLNKHRPPSQTSHLKLQQTPAIPNTKLKQPKQIANHSSNKSCNVDNDRDDIHTTPIRVTVPSTPSSPCSNTYSKYYSNQSNQKDCSDRDHSYRFTQQLLEKDLDKAKNCKLTKEDYDRFQSCYVPDEKTKYISKPRSEHSHRSPTRSVPHLDKSEVDDLSFCWNNNIRFQVTPTINSNRVANSTLEQCGLSPITHPHHSTSIERTKHHDYKDSHISSKCHWSPILAGSLMKSKANRKVHAINELDESDIIYSSLESQNQYSESFSQTDSFYEYGESSLAELPSTIENIDDSTIIKYLKSSPTRTPIFENENTLQRIYGNGTVLYSSYDAPSTNQLNKSSDECITKRTCDWSVSNDSNRVDYSPSTILVSSKIESPTLASNYGRRDCHNHESMEIYSSSSVHNSSEDPCLKGKLTPCIKKHTYPKTLSSSNHVKFKCPITDRTTIPRDFTSANKPCTPLNNTPHQGTLNLDTPTYTKSPHHIQTTDYSSDEEKCYSGADSIDEFESYSIYDQPTAYTDNVRSTYEASDYYSESYSDASSEVYRSDLVESTESNGQDVCRRCGSCTRHTNCNCATIKSPYPPQVPENNHYPDIVIRHIFKAVSAKSCCPDASFTSMTTPGYDLSSNPDEMNLCSKCQGYDCQSDAHVLLDNQPSQRSKSKPRKRGQKTRNTTNKHPVKTVTKNNRVLQPRKVNGSTKYAVKTSKSSTNTRPPSGTRRPTRSQSARSTWRCSNKKQHVKPQHCRVGRSCSTTAITLQRSPIIPVGTALSGRTPMLKCCQTSQGRYYCSKGSKGKRQPLLTCRSAFIHSRACEMALNVLKKHRMPLPKYKESPYWLNPKYLRDQGLLYIYIYNVCVELYIVIVTFYDFTISSFYIFCYLYC